jgi:hypothetical protein
MAARLKLQSDACKVFNARRVLGISDNLDHVHITFPFIPGYNFDKQILHDFFLGGREETLFRYRKAQRANSTVLSFFLPCWSEKQAFHAIAIALGQCSAPSIK